MTRPSKIVLVVLGAALWLGAGLAEPAETSHPRLVRVESTNCSTCHAELFQGKPVVHAPVSEDCTTCHDVAITETGTRVTLTEREPALCLMCHDGLQAAAAFEIEAPHAPVGDSCLSCHQPHAGEQPRLLTMPPRELCAACHDADELQASHGGQVTGRVDCLACHVPHGSENAGMLAGARLHPPFADKTCDACHRAPFAGRVRLQARGERLCTSCHSDMVESPGGEGSVHAAVRGTGRTAGCLSCHDPHMSEDAKLLLTSGPQLCRGCHESVVTAATAETGHAPARDDCTACHLPHSAPHPKLLIEAPGVICAMCHDPEDADLEEAHLGADMASLRCTSCHTPHGAGTPKLLARHVHPVILDGCDTCHEGNAQALMEDGESPLCLACHDDVGELAEQAKVPHGAMEMARCADCHNPHASAQQRLVRLPGGGACLTCHDEQAASPEESSHGAIALVGCRACHEPHGGARPKLLRKEGDALCLDCHSRQKLVAEEGSEWVTLAGRFDVPLAAARSISTLLLTADGTRGHPVPNHPVVGTVTPDHTGRRKVTFTGELGCLTCHDPHKGRSAKLFRWDTASMAEACLHCHPK